jgi:hypothetical protein
MNPTVVILGAILLVVIYVLYTVISEKGKSVVKKAYLNEANAPISYNTLKNPKSSRFCFSSWVYIEELKNGNSVTTDLFRVENESTATGTEDNIFFSLYCNDTASLHYKIRTQNTTTPLVDNEIMTNFPLQKWVCVMVSVDNKIVDLYIDGKLVRSQQLPKQPTKTTDAYMIKFGTGVNGYLAKLERYTEPMDPGTAWSKYMEGNGGNYFSRLLSSYGARFTLTKDDLDMKQFTLF